MQAPPRRNDPCPCGSAKRYKECHGRLAAAPASIDALLRDALALHQRGRIDEAERGYREVLERAPGNTVATHYLGMVAWQHGDLARAERMMDEALAADASVPDFHNNRGLLLRDTGRLDAAIASFEHALRIDPAWNAARNNLALALESAGRRGDAIARYRDAIAREPAFAAAHQNLGRALVAAGDYAHGWEHYRWRLLAQGLAHSAPDPAARPLPASLAGRRLALHSEQGIGDVLFFLRFAPELVRRGAQLAFRGDTRLHAMLERTGLFALGVAAPAAPAPGLEARFVGDLPWLLEMHDAAHFPPPLPLAARPALVERARTALEAHGPRPWIGITWRGGVASAGPARTQLKEIDLGSLGAALRGHDARWIGLQRLPRAGEYSRLSASLGAPIGDHSAANDDLEEMLALLSLLDAYVTVSNANVHLRAGAGGALHVLVPHPPEWRWAFEGTRSPWFAAARAYRQHAQGGWAAALAQLRGAL